MAETQSVTYAAQLAAQNNAGKIIADAALISGKIQNLQCKVTTPSGTAGADTILLGFLPAGAVVLPGASSVCVTAAAGAGTLSIGVAGTAAAIAAGVSVAVGGTFNLASFLPSFLIYESQAVIDNLCAAVTAAKDIYINIAYVFAE
jgi:hypothetical protein